MAEPLYRRVLLKLSGEILAGKDGFGIDPEKASYLANEVKSIQQLGISIGLIIGAGAALNFYLGRLNNADFSIFGLRFIWLDRLLREPRKQSKRIFKFILTLPKIIRLA